jgi:hypothetical protein
MRIALINSMGDFGISTYTHELAEVLVENGAEADVYASDRFNAKIAAFPREHRLYPILNSFIFRRRRREANAGGVSSSVKSAAQPKKTILRPKLPRVRKFLMSAELAWHLREQKYDLVWTQWPEMESYGTAFWSFARVLGMRAVHTVHNVLPHEESAEEKKTYAVVYRSSRRLILHPQFAPKQLASEFPGMEAKAIVSRYRLFTVFPRRPEARAVSGGIAKASGQVMSSTAAPDIPELEWTNIAADLLRQLPS